MIDVIVWHKHRRHYLQAELGTNLLSLLISSNLEFPVYCGGKGTCKKCMVRIVQGQAPLTTIEEEHFSETEKSNGIRLACQVTVESPLELEIAEEEDYQILTSGLAEVVTPMPRIRKQIVSKDKIRVAEGGDYLKALRAELAIEGVSRTALQQLSQCQEVSTWTAVIYDDELVWLTPKADTSNYGVAVDIGTTTMAFYLLDLESGKEIDSYPMANPQRQYGADVISRLQYGMEEPTGTSRLHNSLLGGIRQGVSHLLEANSLTSQDVFVLTAVGNTVMLHSLLGVAGGSIAVAPFTPIFTDAFTLPATELLVGINPLGIVQILPSVSGYVGADVISGLLPVYRREHSGYFLYIDIGTNGEIVLGNNQKLYACATAAGPAFEGATISRGMPAIKGAIASFSLGKDGGKYKVIGDVKPRGICGSGLLDVVAELFREGVVAETGAFTTDQAYYVVATETESESGDELTLTQKDIREVQLAKGAIAAGIRGLIREAGIDLSQIEKVYLAGGFGNYLNPASACAIGLIPATLEDKVEKVGNAAGHGACLATLDRSYLAKALDIQGKVRYIELSNDPNFQMDFMNAMIFSQE